MTDEDLRHALFDYLAERRAHAFSADVLRRAIQRSHGTELTPERVLENIDLLIADGLAARNRDPLGSTHFYRISPQGLYKRQAGEI